jgi:hypothetical protein
MPVRKSGKRLLGQDKRVVGEVGTSISAPKATMKAKGDVLVNSRWNPGVRYGQDYENMPRRRRSPDLDSCEWANDRICRRR